MRNVYSVELRNIEIGIGLDHERLRADIYMEGKKIGAVLNDGWCDETYYEFRSKRSECQFENIIKNKSISKDEFIDIFYI